MASSQFGIYDKSGKFMENFETFETCDAAERALANAFSDGLALERGRYVVRQLETCEEILDLD